MDIKVKSSLYKERDLLNSLLQALDEQYSILLASNKDAVDICCISDKIDSIVKEIALTEIDRRNIIANDFLILQINSSDDEELSELIKDMSRLKNLIEKQNDINNSFIKQNLFFTRKMLKIITPGDKFETYNSAGKIGKIK